MGQPQSTRTWREQAEVEWSASGEARAPKPACLGLWRPRLQCWPSRPLPACARRRLGLAAASAWRPTSALRPTFGWMETLSEPVQGGSRGQR